MLCISSAGHARITHGLFGRRLHNMLKTLNNTLDPPAIYRCGCLAACNSDMRQAHIFSPYLVPSLAGFGSSFAFGILTAAPFRLYRSAYSSVSKIALAPHRAQRAATTGGIPCGFRDWVARLFVPIGPDAPPSSSVSRSRRSRF